MKPLLALAAVLSLAACTTPTVYAPATGPKASGFSEYRLENDRWRVTYRGGSGAPAMQVADLALLRAGELAIQTGYDWFRVVDRFDETRGGGGGGPRTSLSVGGGSSNYGWGRSSGVGLGIGTSFDLSGGPQISRTIEVVMGKGPKPVSVDVYDARAVVREIQAPRV